MASITRTAKRRERRQRAQARLDWFLHRKGHTQLSLSKLNQILGVLARHHSRDIRFLAKIKAEMAKAHPWRCRLCKQLTKGNTDWCGRCGQHWQQCQDTSYTFIETSKAQPWQSQGSWGEPDRSYGHQWDWTWQQATSQSPRRRRSPRNRGKGKQDAKGWTEGKGYKGDGKGKTEPASGTSFPMWLPPMPPWPSSSTTLAPSPETTYAQSSSAKESEELAKLRNLARMVKNQTGLPADLAKAMETIDAGSWEKEETREYRQLVSAWGQARKSMESLNQGWRTYREAWMTYCMSSR